MSLHDAVADDSCSPPKTYGGSKNSPTPEIDNNSARNHRQQKAEPLWALPFLQQGFDSSLDKKDNTGAYCAPTKSRPESSWAPSSHFDTVEKMTICDIKYGLPKIPISLYLDKD